MTTDESGKTLFTASEDCTIKVWEMDTGMLIRVGHRPTYTAN